MDKIYNTIKTEDNRNDFITFIDSVKESLFKTDSSLETFLKNNINSPYLKSLSTLLPKGWDKMEDKSLIQTKLTTLVDELENLRTIDLTLSFEPNQTIINSIESWAENNLSQKVIFNVNVNPEILGGAIIITDGKYIDMSLSKKLNDVFMTRKTDILNLIKE